MRNTVNQTIRLVALMAAFIPVAMFAGDKGLQAGNAFPDIAGFPLEGKVPNLKDKVVIVDFWASWCGPCKESFPIMEDLQSRFGAKGLVVLAVNVDDDVQAMNDFLKKHPVTFPVVRDAKKKLVSAVNIKSMPCSFVLTPQGKVATVHKGFHGEQTRAQYTKEIEELIAGNPSRK